jgi:integrase
MLKEPKSQGRALTPSEETDLLAACRESISRVLYPAVALALYAAMRRDEIRLLKWSQIVKWSQIDLDKAYLVVGASKTTHGEGRVIPLIGLAHEALIDWAAAFPNRQPSHYVFPLERYAFNSENGLTTVHRHDPTKPIGSWTKAWVRYSPYLRYRTR